MVASIDRLKSVGHRVFDLGFAAKVSAGKLLGLIDFPVPPRHNLATTSSNTVRHYYESGLTTIQPILIAAMAEGVDFSRDLNVLDFGCGAGRQLLHLLGWYPNLKVYGNDIDGDCVAYVQRTFPTVDAHTSDFDPPLKFPDGMFDVIYSVSIFSHVSQDDALPWLKEMSRITRPGGVVLLTFNSSHALTVSHEIWHARTELTHAALDQEGYLFDGKEISEESSSEDYFGKKGRGVKRVYGEAYYSHAGFADLASQFFDVRKFYPAVIDRLQDLAVLVRR